MIPSPESPIAPKLNPHEVIRDVIADAFDISKSSASIDAETVLVCLKDHGYEVRRPNPAAPVPVDLEAATTWFGPGPDKSITNSFGRALIAEIKALRSRLSEAASAAVQGGDTREALAALCHEQWSGWMRYLFGKCEILPNGDKGDLAVIPEWAVQRWKMQMETAYADLTDAEKESDRGEADKILSLIQPQPQPQHPGEAK